MGLRRGAHFAYPTNENNHEFSPSSSSSSASSSSTDLFFSPYGDDSDDNDDNDVSAHSIKGPRCCSSSSSSLSHLPHHHTLASSSSSNFSGSFSSKQYENCWSGDRLVGVIVSIMTTHTPTNQLTHIYARPFPNACKGVFALNPPLDPVVNLVCGRFAFSPFPPITKLLLPLLLPLTLLPHRDRLFSGRVGQVSTMS